MSGIAAAETASVPSPPGYRTTASSMPTPGSSRISRECVETSTCGPPALRVLVKTVGSCRTTDVCSDGSGSSRRLGPRSPLPSRREANKSKRPIRKRLLVVSRGLWTPMPVTCLQMPVSNLVLNELELVQLGDCRLQRLADATKMSSTCPRRRPRHAEQEIGTVGVTVRIADALGFPHQMRNQVEITNGLKEFRDPAKLPVRVHLFKVRLGHALGVGLVLIRRSLDDRSSPPAHNLDPDYVRSSCSNLRTSPRPDPGGVHGVLQLFRPVLGHRQALPAT